MEEFKEHRKVDKVGERVQSQIEKTNRHKVFRKVHFRYMVRRWRAKISLIALMNRRTVIEHFHCTILRSFKELVKSGEIPDISKDQKLRNMKILDAMGRPRIKGFSIHIQKFNNNKFTEKWLEEKIAKKLQEEKDADCLGDDDQNM